MQGQQLRRQALIQAPEGSSGVQRRMVVLRRGRCQMTALSFGGETSEGRTDMALMTPSQHPPLQLPLFACVPSTSRGHSIPAAPLSSALTTGPKFPQMHDSCGPQASEPWLFSCSGDCALHLCCGGGQRLCPIGIAGGHLWAQTKAAPMRLSPFLGQ